MNATEERVELAVSGMTCASCVRHVAKALQRVPGVDEASVNLATERATVSSLRDHDFEAGAPVAAIERAGYRASIVADGARADDEDAARREREMARSAAS